MTKIKNGSRVPRQFYWFAAIGSSFVIGLLAGLIFVPSLTPTLVDYLVVSSTPQIFGSPQVNYTFISPQESATAPNLIQFGSTTETPSYAELETTFVDSVAMCAEVPRNTGGQYVFRIWLQQSMELFRLDSDGNNLCRLTNNTVNDDQPKWSPDGEYIAFVSSLEGYGIYIMDADGSNIEPVTTEGSAYSYPAWSPDGNTLIFQATIDEQFDIYRIDVDGTNLQNLTSQERLDTMAVWSPDGNYIAFTSDRIFNPYSPNNSLSQDRSYDIYMMNADGLGVRRLTVTSGIEEYPSWSPDSQQIAFASHYQIMLMNKDGSNVTHLARGNYPVWLPDGQRIAFVQQDIYTINGDGTDMQQVSTFAIPPGSGIQNLDYTGQ